MQMLDEVQEVEHLDEEVDYRVREAEVDLCELRCEGLLRDAAERSTCLLSVIVAMWCFRSKISDPDR